MGYRAGPDMNAGKIVTWVGNTYRKQSREEIKGQCFRLKVLGGLVKG